MAEVALALWLISSGGVLGHSERPELAIVDLSAGAAVIIIVALSLLPRLQHLHVATLLVALFLIAWAWVTFQPRPGPAGAQNQILVGLLLGLLAVVPGLIDRPPESWRRYVERS
jgi:hypothetical protein